ncbi:MAG: LytTR family DNA-binding domain-containing protein [Terracidiphilus sp.]
MIHVVMADDEVLARQKLRQFLRDESDLEIVGESATASETVELVRLAKPELLFLDIRMPGMDGFDIIAELTSCATCQVPRIIFTTAYDQYAVRAFEIHAVDYLLKPFTQERFRSAIQRVRQQMNAPDQRPEPANGRSGEASRYATRIVFKSRGRILFLPVSEIRWIGAEENYVRICTESENHLLRETMAHLEERLDPQMFLRVHRSSIVNLQYVKEVRTEPNGDFSVVLVNGQKIAMSRSYRSRVSEWLIRN